MKNSSAPYISSPLAQYVPIADLLVATFGPDCEVVLHDLSTPEHSVVYVANGTVTGRTVGDSFQHLITQALIADENRSGIIANYYFKHQKKVIRSSSLFLRDEQNRLIGALCINMDTTRVTEQIKFLNSLIPDFEHAHGNSAPTTHQLTESIDPNHVQPNMLDVVTDIIDGVIRQAPKPYTRERRLEMIRFMESRGVFLMKGAVDLVAERLEMSRVTVYSYIDEVRKN